MIIEAILKINPNAVVTVRGSDINTCEIEWHDGTPEISKADIEAKMAELQAEYDAEEWKRNRQAEYPSHEDCIHALLDGGDTLTELQAKRTATKNKYPKPGA
tara:strand:+ start:417 stop:722 length:306 start_codon:yes stop_codon:yes gene_type:complete